MLYCTSFCTFCSKLHLKISKAINTKSFLAESTKFVFFCTFFFCGCSRIPCRRVQSYISSFVHHSWQLGIILWRPNSDMFTPMFTWNGNKKMFTIMQNVNKCYRYIVYLDLARNTAHNENHLAAVFKLPVFTCSTAVQHTVCVQVAYTALTLLVFRHKWQSNLLKNLARAAIPEVFLCSTGADRKETGPPKYAWETSVSFCLLS